MRVLREPDFSNVLRQSERARARTTRVAIPGLLIIAAAVPVALLVRSLLASVLAFLVLMFIGFAIWIAGSPNMAHVRRLKAGMKGELDVISELHSLDDSWCLLNSVRFPPGLERADHVLVGPPGVFVLETKNHSGGIVCEGDDWSRGNWTPKRPPRNRESTGSPSLQAKRYACLLEERLAHSKFKVQVRPVVVFTNPHAKLWLKKPTVPVVRLSELNGYLQGQNSGAWLSGEKVTTIAKKILIRTTS